MAKSDKPLDALPKLVAVSSAFIAIGVAYSQVATEEYVDEKHGQVEEQMDKLTTAQTETAKQVESLARFMKSSEQRAVVQGRLLKVLYVEHVEIEETRPKRMRNRPRSAKSRRAAKMLDVNPDDPLNGLDLLTVE